MKLVRFDGGRVGVVRGEFIIDVTTAAQIRPNEFPTVGMNRLIVDNELRQNANMHDLFVDIPGMIAMTSAVMTLYPGDIIFGGTPAGIGPIQTGDLVTIEIEQIGRMAIRVIQGAAAPTARSMALIRSSTAPSLAPS